MTQTKLIDQNIVINLTQNFSETFSKIVKMLLDRHAPIKTLNKKPNMFSSKSRVTTGIAKSQ